MNIDEGWCPLCGFPTVASEGGFVCSRGERCGEREESSVRETEPVTPTGRLATPSPELQELPREVYKIIRDEVNPNNLRISSNKDRHICKVYGYTPREARAKAARIVAGLTILSTKNETEESYRFILETGKLAENYTIPMVLNCPQCGERHIDEAEFAEVAHHTHACQGCGFVWRPAKVNTHGVRFLPGYTNIVPASES